MQNDLFYEKADTKIISLNTVHNQIYFYNEYFRNSLQQIGKQIILFEERYNHEYNRKTAEKSRKRICGILER